MLYGGSSRWSWSRNQVITCSDNWLLRSVTASRCAVPAGWRGVAGADRIVAGLGVENYRRLAGVKAEFDPENVFHLNHNIKPG